MGRKKHYNDKNYCTTVGDSLNNGIWLLETRSYKQNAWGGVEALSFHGTGFLFKRKTAFLTRCFLVSNKHVLVEDNPQCLLLKLPSVEENGIVKYPGVTYPLYPTRGKNILEEPLSSVVHAHPTLDLAIIDVTEKIRELEKEFKYRNFKVDSLETKNLPLSWDIQKDRPMHYVGFPDEQTKPIPFHGHIKENPKCTRNVDISDVFVAQGASGSPAFLNEEEHHYPKFLGIMESTESMQVVEGERQHVIGHAVKSCDLLDFINEVLHKKGFHM